MNSWFYNNRVGVFIYFGNSNNITIDSCDFTANSVAKGGLISLISLPTVLLKEV